MRKLDKNINLYMIIVRSFLTLIFLAFFIVAIAVPGEYYEEIIFKYVLISVAAFLLIIGIVFSVIVPLYTHKLYAYDINEEEVVIQKGVVFRKRIVIQVKRIQHVEKHQGPLQLLFKQATIVIYTAGSVATILGLNVLQAEEVLKELNEKLNVYLKLDKDLQDEQVSYN